MYIGADAGYSQAIGIEDVAVEASLLRLNLTTGSGRHFYASVAALLMASCQQKPGASCEEPSGGATQGGKVTRNASQTCAPPRPQTKQVLLQLHLRRSESLCAYGE